LLVSPNGEFISSIEAPEKGGCRVKHSAGLFVALLAAVTYAGAATSPSVHIVSPIVVNSGSPNTGLWSGSSPMHLVAYAESTDCPSGINAIQVYVADGVVAYQTYSTYVDIEVPLGPDRVLTVVKVWDNCGGVNEAYVQNYAQLQSGITVLAPIPNIVYEANSATIPVSATATTTCSKGVAAMGVYTANHVLVYSQQGKTLQTYLNLPAGTYNLVIEEWDNCAGATTSPVNLVVGEPGLGEAGMYAYMPDPATGRTDSFWMDANCSLYPTLGTPNPAVWNPISVSSDFDGFVYVLNQVSLDLSIYEADVLNETGSLTQIPGSPFSLNQATAYTPTSVLAVDNGAGVTGVYIANTSASGPGTISEFNFNHTSQTLTAVAGSPLALKGPVEPNLLVLGPTSANLAPLGENWVFAGDGSSMSILKLDVGANPPLVESSQSPIPITGAKGQAAQALDVSWGSDGVDYLVFTANSDNSISAFEIGSNGTLSPAAGSPYANPDSPAGTNGNPASVAFDGYSGQLFGLDAGSSSLSIWAVDHNTGALSYQGVQQAGKLTATLTDKLRSLSDIPVDCLVTSNGYGLSVNYNTGQTTLAAGSPVLNLGGNYPSVSPVLFSPPF
jgi:hypothetical protein